MNESLRHAAVAALATALLWTWSAHAQPTAGAAGAASADHSARHPPASALAAASTAAAPLSEGEVRRVDLAQGKVTLRHGPLVNLEMPPMTMVFTATDPRLLEGLKEGDKVRFTADKVDGRYVVTVIRPAN